MRLGAKPILIAAAVLAGGGALFVKMAGPDGWAMLKMVAICGAAIVGLGAMIIYLHRKGLRERQTMVAETNAALRTLASCAHLDIVEPPQRDERQPSIDPFCEAQGSYRGIRVRARVESDGDDRLSTALQFMHLVLDRRQLKSLSKVIDRSYKGDSGVTVYLDRGVKLWAETSYSRIPETDVARLQLALDRVCDLAGMSQVAAGPKAGR